MKPSRYDLLELLRLLDITEAREIDCDEFLQRAAGFVERVHAGVEPRADDSAVAHHLRICPECLEEYRALYDLYRGDGT